MENINGSHYRDHRRVDSDRPTYDDIYNRATTGNGTTSGGGNSLSLEELFINETTTGNGYDHHHHRTTTVAAVSSQDIIRLDHPRPDVLRARNEYVDVTRPTVHSRIRPAHRDAPPLASRQSTGQFPSNTRHPHHLTNGHHRRADIEGLQLAHRAHSVPLQASTMVCTPSVCTVMASVVNNDGGSSTIRNDHCLYCIDRPLLASNTSPVCMEINFDRIKSNGSTSKSAATLTNVCLPSTSSSSNHKPPIPGRAVRQNSNASSTNRNVNVSLPNSSNIISSQPRNLSSSNSSFEKKNNLNGKRSGGAGGGVSECCTNKDEIVSSRPTSKSDCSSSSLMCKDCGRCRCAACKEPKTIPSRWINDSWLLSSKSVVDALSCMCCVKGCLYHVGANSEDLLDERYLENSSSNGFSKPSTSSSSDTTTDSNNSSSIWSCTRFGSRNCCTRWTILSSALVCLPCLWCYLPLKGCAGCCESIYSHYHDHGCRCDRRQKSTTTTEKSQHSPKKRDDRSVTRRLRRKRSHTLPPELPSIAAAKANYDHVTTSRTNCAGVCEYS